MSNYKKMNVMQGYATSLADNPCINMCGNLTVGGNDSCKYCGRTQEQIAHWQTYPVTVKKLITPFCFKFILLTFNFKFKKI